MSSETTAASGGLFVRNATGLVREMSQRDNLILAALAGAPAAFVALTVLFVLSGLSGGNVFVGGLLCIPLVLAFSYAFGLMSAVLPRSGGDYTIVTRILTPELGVVSSFCMVFGGFVLSGAFLARVFTTLGIAPSLQTVGIVADSKTLFDAGSTVASSQAWQYGLGLLMFAIGAGAHLAGPRWAKRVLATGFFVSTGGLAIAVLIALFTSRSGFAADFNSTAAAFSGIDDAYGATIAGGERAGLELSPAFSLAATIPVIGVFATNSIYTYFGSFAAGELRQASSTRTANRMALGGITSIAIILLSCWILFSTWGKPFLTAAAGGGYPAELGGTPPYFALTSFQVGSPLFAVLICLSFLLVFPMFATQQLLGITRIFFAWSFDGILPEKVAAVSRRTNAPTGAIVLAVVLYAIGMVWSVFASDSLVQVIVYATVIQLFAMMLVGVSAIALPWRRPELYRASGITRTLAGIPLVQIAGAAAVAGGAFMIWLFFHYPFFGLADKGKFFAYAGGTIVVALVYYAVVRVMRMRQGTDLRLVYAEIPPE